MTDTAAYVATDLMNRIYRHQRHIYDVTRKFFLLGRDGLVQNLSARDGEHVLEIGCGTGRNLIVAAQRYPGARFVGIDISTAMLTTAIGSIAKAGLSSRIRVAHANATRLTPGVLPGTSQFERIFISYSLSMIPDWRGVIAAATTMLTPGGELHIVDFGGQERLPSGFKSVLRAWLGVFHVTPRDELEAVLRAHAAEHDATLVFDRPFRGYAQYAVLRRAS